MDGHVQVRVNLQAAAVHNLYSAKALGCIVNGHHGHAHDFLQDLNGVEWNGERLMVTWVKDVAGIEKQWWGRSLNVDSLNEALGMQSTFVCNAWIYVYKVCMYVFWKKKEKTEKREKKEYVCMYVERKNERKKY